MVNWRKKIKIKQFLTESEKHEDIQKSMNQIADVLEKHHEFLQPPAFLQKMRNIPKGDDVITPSDYANKLLAAMYDIADEELIWIE